MTNSKVCRYCQRKFSSSSNRHRNEIAFHHHKPNQISDDDDNDSSDALISEKGTNEGFSDPEPTDDEEEESDTDSDEEVSHWEVLIREACQEVKGEMKNIKDVLREQNYDTFLDILQDKLNEKMRFAAFMRDKDPVYVKIQETANEDMGDLDDEEALAKAWNKRKYLLKWLLKSYSDVIDEELNDSETRDMYEREQPSDIQNFL